MVVRYNYLNSIINLIGLKIVVDLLNKNKVHQSSENKNIIVDKLEWGCQDQVLCQ